MLVWYEPAPSGATVPLHLSCARVAKFVYVSIILQSLPHCVDFGVVVVLLFHLNFSSFMQAV